jgi:ubiquinone/menaquinone biosynthesis C-methylase UbiE
VSAPTTAAEWYLDEAFWIGQYDNFFTSDRFAAAVGEVERALDLTGVGAGSVLDVCCGPGRHAVELARRGLRVVGVDASEYLLDRARRRAREAGVVVEFTRGDVHELDRPDRFDLAVSFWTSFGYFHDPDDDLLMARRVRCHLIPGGVFLLEMLSKEILARVFQPTSARLLADGTIVVQLAEVLESWRRFRNTHVVVTDDRVRRFSFEQTIYSGQEMASLMRAAGFADVALWGSLDGAPYGPDAQRLIVVARAGRPPSQ